jgi:hypothetical protein
MCAKKSYDWRMALTIALRQTALSAYWKAKLIKGLEYSSNSGWFMKRANTHGGPCRPARCLEIAVAMAHLLYSSNSEFSVRQKHNQLTFLRIFSPPRLRYVPKAAGMTHKRVRQLEREPLTAQGCTNSTRTSCASAPISPTRTSTVGSWAISSTRRSTR